MAVAVKEYPLGELAAQPIGYWSGEAYRAVVGRIWLSNSSPSRLGGFSTMSLMLLASGVEVGSPSDWRPSTTWGSTSNDAYDDLLKRGWIVEDSDATALTDLGEAGRVRARERATRTHEQTDDGIAPEDYAAALNVLRRMIANLGAIATYPDATRIDALGATGLA